MSKPGQEEQEIVVILMKHLRAIRGAEKMALATESKDDYNQLRLSRILIFHMMETIGLVNRWNNKWNCFAQEFLAMSDKPYKIECRACIGDEKYWSWKTWRRYKTEVRAKMALESLQKDSRIMEFRLIDGRE